MVWSTDVSHTDCEYVLLTWTQTSPWAIKVSFQSFKNRDVTRGQYRGIISELSGGKAVMIKTES